jgi:hypothetical protein
MKRAPTVFATLGMLFLTSVMLGQEMSQPGPTLPSDILGPQLIAWSQQQEPHRVPQPLPYQQPANAQARPHPGERTFTGRITNDGRRYILRVSSDTAYQVNDQQQARQYEGKR